MKIKTETYIQYKIGADKVFSSIKLCKDGWAQTEWFRAEKKIVSNDFSDDHSIRIVLAQETSISLTAELVCILNENEKTGILKNLIPVFTHKYFSPVLKSIETSERKLVLHANRNYATAFEKTSSSSFKIKFIIDAPYMHPSWDLSDGVKKSTANEIQKKDTEYTCNFSLISLFPNDEFVPVMPMIYPKACGAAFILTDHCDFDTAEKLKLFLYGNNNDGWLGKNLKITKGVFTLSSRSKDFTKNDSLEEKEYSELIQKLYEDGSEIAPHALKSKGQLNAEAFHSALQKISLCFKPQTWIDHGSYLKYCYSQGGKNNPDYMLVQALQKNNFTSLWSFHDVNIDALNTLNIFASKKYSSISIWKKIYAHLVKGKWMIASHYFRSLWHRNYKQNVIFDSVIYAMASTKGALSESKNKMKLFSAISIFFKSFRHKQQKKNIALPYNNDQLLCFSDAIFPEEKRPIAQYKESDILMFSTFETTHVKDIYCKRALDKLIEEYGLHIGHTYILNNLPYLNNIFNERKGEKILSKEWIDFTNVLSEYVGGNEIWNPSMGEFINYLTLVLNIYIKYTSPNTIEIKNPANVAIEDFTLIVPIYHKKNVCFGEALLKPSKTDRLFNFFTFDIPPATTLNLFFI